MSEYLYPIFEEGVASGDNDKVGVDSSATAGFLGAASNDGVLRTDSSVSYTDGGNFVTLGVASSLKTETIEIRLDGNGFALTTGTKYPSIEVPFACTIVGSRLLLDQSSTTTIDLWKDTYANYPPDNSDSITASAPVATSAAVKSEDTTLTGWTTTLSRGDIILANIDANDNATFATVVLDVTRS
jgi:hypothetical protein